MPVWLFLSALLLSPAGWAGREMPPVGCLQTAAGARWCVSDVRLRSAVSVPVVSGPHPATVVQPARPYYSVGQVVPSLPELLPERRRGRYEGAGEFVVR